MNILSFAMCRMQPPTVGHVNIMDALETAPGDKVLFLSKKHDKKDNPLSFETRCEFLKMKYYNLMIRPIESLYHAFEWASGRYDIVNVVCGSDRFVEYHKFKRYEVELKFSINVVQCESDSRHLVSGSLLRSFCINKDKINFIKYCMFDDYRSEQLYDIMTKELNC